MIPDLAFLKVPWCQVTIEERIPLKGALMQRCQLFNLAMRCCQERIQNLYTHIVEIAYQEEISLENYLRVAAIAEEQWTERQTALLEYTRSKKSFSLQGQVDVFLHEKLIGEAIASLEPYASHTLIEQVVDAALQSRSHFEWVIQASHKQAEPIIEGGKAEYYHAAAKWLAKARTAYQALGRKEERQTYLSDLLSRHGRKYKLVPLLKALQ